MPFHMRFATSADGPALAAIYLSAFHDNPVAMSCFPPSSQACREFLATTFAEEISNPRFQWLVVTDADSEDGPDFPVACAKWVLPAKDGEENVEPMPPVDVWPKEGNPEFADHFFGSIVKRHTEIMGHVRHYYLELIICRKEQQGRGAASPLMKWGCERADEESMLAFLEAMPAAKPVYERYGFLGVDRQDMTAPNGAAVPQTFMLRQGKAAQEFKGVLAKLEKSE